MSGVQLSKGQCGIDTHVPDQPMSGACQLCVDNGCELTRWFEQHVARAPSAEDRKNVRDAVCSFRAAFENIRSEPIDCEDNIFRGATTTELHRFIELANHLSVRILRPLAEQVLDGVHGVRSVDIDLKTRGEQFASLLKVLQLIRPRITAALSELHQRKAQASEQMAAT